MQILTNHLTRMSKGHICASGINKDLHHIRLINRTEYNHRSRLTADLLESRGGPIDIGNIIDIGPFRHIGSVPEIEDYLCYQTRFVKIKRIEPLKFWKVLKKISKPKFTDLFGDDICRTRDKCILPINKGICSLGVFKPTTPPIVNYSYDGSKVFVKVSDGSYTFNLRITDIRIYNIDDNSIIRERVLQIIELIENSPEMLLSLGFTRPFSPRSDLDKVHWMQVNNIHFSKNPYW